MVRKLALSGLAALVLVGSGCMQKYNPKIAEEIGIVSREEREEEHADIKGMINKINSDWKVRPYNYTADRYEGIFEKGNSSAFIFAERFRDKETLTNFLLERYKNAEVRKEERCIEIPYKVKDMMIGDVVFPGTTNYLELIAIKDNIVFKLSIIEPSAKEKQELRRLLYSLVK